jgi:uncharacterized protein
MLSIGLQFTTGSVQTSAAPSNSIIAIVGTAAIGEKDKPVVVKNLTQAITSFGYPTTGTTIPDALHRAYQSYGQIPFIAVNVYAGVAVVAVVEAEYTFDSQDRISLPHKHASALVVKNQAGSTTYVLNTDYTADLVRGIIQRKGTAIAPNATVKISYSRPDFTGVTDTLIVGGVNGTTGKREGLEALVDAELVSLTPSNITDIICPGYSQMATVATKMASMAIKLRSQYYLDAPASATVAQVLAGRTASSVPVAHFGTRDENAILCYPNVLADTKEEWYSCHVAFARAIAPEWQAPTNLQVRGITGWKTVLLTSSSDPDADNSKLVNQGVVTYLNRSGQNPSIWGHFNASFPIPAEETARKGFDRIHTIRIKNSVRDALETQLSTLIGNRLGMNWDGAIAALERLGTATIQSNQGVESGRFIFLPEMSSLAQEKLAFRVEIVIPGALNLITFDLVFVVGGV